MSTQRKFDFDKKSQAKIVRALFQFQDQAHEAIETVPAAMFDTAPMRWVVDKMQWCHKRHMPATMTILEHEAAQDVKLGRIGSGHITAFANFLARLEDPVPDKTYLLDKIYEQVKVFRLTESTIEIARRLKDPARINWKELDKLVASQHLYGDRLDKGHAVNYFDDTRQRIKRRRSVELVGVPTGIGCIDTKLRQGGLPPKQLGVVVAPPGRGKTASLVYMGRSAVLNGKVALYVSLELDKDMIGERFDASFSSIKIQQLASRSVTLRKRIAQISQTSGGKLFIEEFPTDVLTMTMLRTFLRRMEAMSVYPDVLLIDYADNMNLGEFESRRGESDYGVLGNLYKSLRSLAGELNLPIWTASQSNRLSLDKQHVGKDGLFGMEHLADSFKKAAVCDVMYGIAQTDVQRARKAANILLLKNRNGPAGMVSQVRFDTAKVLIQDS